MLRCGAALCAAAAAAAAPPAEWAAFKRAHRRAYGTPAGDAARAAVYAANARAAAALSAADPAAQYGAGPFSDLTAAEFAAARLHPVAATAAARPPAAVRSAAPPGGKVDWRASGAVTGVHDQGQVGSPFVYPVADVVAAQNEISNGKQLVDLSYQQLSDCAGLGRLGTDLSKALEYVKKTGLETQGYYAAHPSCDIKGPVETISTSVSLAQDEADILAWLNSTGPVIVGVDATSWQQYTGGVLSTGCTSINHFALLVGYNSGYWVLKNSWGTSWGESGYIRLAYGSDACGVAQLATGVRA